MLAIVLSVLSLNYFFLRPGFSFSPISYADLVYLTFCIFFALAVGWVSAVRRRTEQEFRQARDELEAKVVERTANLQRSESYLAETRKLTHSGSWAWDARSQKVLFCPRKCSEFTGWIRRWICRPAELSATSSSGGSQQDRREICEGGQ